MDYSVSTLVIAPPSRLRNALIVILKAIPLIKSVATADNPEMALDATAVTPPDILFLDATILKPTQKILPKPCHDAACIVLVEYEWQRRLAHQLDADIVLMRGFSVDTLKAAITNALLQKHAVVMAAS